MSPSDLPLANAPELDREAALRAHLGKITHGLRNSANGILGFAQLLEAGAVAPPSPLYLEYLQEILTSSQRLVAGLDELSELAGGAARPDATPKTDRAPRPDSPSSRKVRGEVCRVLLVVADLRDQELARDLLEAEGREVRAALPEAALAVIERFEPRLVILDLALEGALELARRAKDAPCRGERAIVALTGPLDDWSAAIASGCDGTVAKPLDARTFAGMVMGYVRSPRARAGNGSP